MASEETVKAQLAVPRKSHISRLYSPEQIKKLFGNALLIDLDDNNEKADVIQHILGPQFIELGPGTNRHGMLGPDGYCHKIALDRRGIVDNVTEFKRAKPIEWCAPKVYETNGLILVAENVELMTKENFIANKEHILAICHELAKVYIFEDIGFAGKNFCNWGIRNNGDLVILDTGYMIPILGHEDAMSCPVCGAKLKNNSLYTGYVCTNSRCNTLFTFIDLYRRIGRSFDDDLYENITGYSLPDFDGFNDKLYNSGIMKGGHIHYEGPSSKPIGTVEDSSDDIVGVEGILANLQQQGLLP